MKYLMKLLDIKRSEILATLLGMAGAFLNAFMIREGFILLIFSDLLWIYFALSGKIKHWWMAANFLVFTVISFIGLFIWRN